jgi:hypothetical protein
MIEIFYGRFFPGMKFFGPGFFPRKIYCYIATIPEPGAKQGPADFRGQGRPPALGVFL